MIGSKQPPTNLDDVTDEELARRRAARLSGRKMLEAEEAVEEHGHADHVQTLRFVVQERMERQDGGPSPCPRCGQAAGVKAKDRRRTLRTMSGEIELRRHYHYCEGCEHGFYPLDLELGLPSQGELSPKMLARVLDFGVSTVFGEAAERWRVHHSGSTVSENLVRRVVERVGQGLEQQPAKERQQAVRPVAPQSPQTLLSEVVKLSAGKEVVLHEVEQPLDDRRAIGVPLFVRPKLETALLGKCRHLRHRHHVGARSVKNDHARVVDHADPAVTADVVDRIVEEDLALEARKARVQLNVRQPRVGQRQPGDLDLLLATRDVRLVRGGVVLHLLARLVVVLSSRLLRLVADAVAAAVRGQCRVGHLGTVRLEFLVDAHEIALALRQQLHDVVVVPLGFLGPVQWLHLGRATGDHLAYRAARHTHSFGDRPRAV